MSKAHEVPLHGPKTYIRRALRKKIFKLEILFGSTNLETLDLQHRDEPVRRSSPPVLRALLRGRSWRRRLLRVDAHHREAPVRQGVESLPGQGQLQGGQRARLLRAPVRRHGERRGDAGRRQRHQDLPRRHGLLLRRGNGGRTVTTISPSIYLVS